MRCSIIIRCFNEEKHLPRLFEGIRRQTVQPDELIVVDSGSTDRTVQIAQGAGARVVSIAQQEFSFGRSLNRGAATATGEALVMVSAHTYPLTERWLELLLEPFCDSRVALAYGGQRGDPRTKFSEHQLLRQWFPEESCYDQRHPFCNNANAAVRRLRWEEISYDEQLLGLEDIQWGKQALERGHRIVYRHDAAVVHVHEESYRKIFHRYRREAMALKRISPAERMGFKDALSLMASAIRSDCREARRQRVLLQALGSVLLFRTAQYAGAYRGLLWQGALTSDLRARLYYPKGYQSRPAELPLSSGFKTERSSVPVAVGEPDAK